MTPPRLEPVSVRSVAGASSFARAGVRCFAVVRTGVYAGRWFYEGDVLVVGGTPTEGALSVLVTDGLGRPMLGRARGGRLFGDADEPCAPARWRLAGLVLDVLRGAYAPADQLALFAA